MTNASCTVQERRQTTWNGSWHYIYHVSSRERWYGHLGEPAETEFCKSGWGATKHQYARNYYTYQQIRTAIAAYNARPRTEHVHILAKFGPDPGPAPFPGREWIGAPNERSRHERFISIWSGRASTRRRDGTLCYYVSPDEPAAKHLGLTGRRRKSFPKEELESVWPQVVRDEMARFDTSWTDGTWPTIVDAQQTIRDLERKERREVHEARRRAEWADYDRGHQRRRVVTTLWDHLTDTPSGLYPIGDWHFQTLTLPPGDGPITCLGGEDRVRQEGCRPHSPERVISRSSFDTENRERRYFRRLIESVGPPDFISNAGELWWFGHPGDLADRALCPVWGLIDEGDGTNYPTPRPFRVGHPNALTREVPPRPLPAGQSVWGRLQECD